MTILSDDNSTRDNGIRRGMDTVAEPYTAHKGSWMYRAVPLCAVDGWIFRTNYTKQQK